MKRKIALLLIAAMIGSSLSGCSNSEAAGDAKEAEATNTADSANETESANATEAASAADGQEADKDVEWFGTEDGETVTIRVWGGVQPEYGYDELISNFNEEYADKGVQAEYVRFVNDSSGNMQLETYLMGGGEVDVFMGYKNTTFHTRVDSNLVLNITDRLEEYGFDLEKELGKVNASSFYFDDNQVYGFPTKYENNRWMMVNVDMFEEAGVEVPYDGWTYDEFLSAMEKLTKGEGQDKVYGVCWALKQTFAAAKGLVGSVLGEKDTYKDETATQVNYDDPIWKDGLEMIKTSIDNGWAIPYEDEVSESMTVANTFLEEKCAATLCISQMRLVMDSVEYPHDFKTALVPGPVPSEEYMTDEYKYHSNMPGDGDIIAIAANTEYPDAAFEFMMWYVTGGMAPLAKGGRIPLWNGIDQDNVVAMVMENAGDTIDEQSLRNYLSIDKTQTAKKPISDKGSEVDTVFKEEVEAFLYSQQSVDEAIANIVSRSNEILQQK
ncbi:MAG: extracellular solute-binding protein [Lachnospiraceae bacterium]|nr:extracellular solute-binding protein [Lachnospiraceae bacterium]